MVKSPRSFFEVNGSRVSISIRTRIAKHITVNREGRDGNYIHLYTLRCGEKSLPVPLFEFEIVTGGSRYLTARPLAPWRSSTVLTNGQHHIISFSDLTTTIIQSKCISE
jgi:hypothetical protein